MQEMQEAWVLTLRREDPLEKGMAPHSSILAWKTAWAGKPGGLESMWSQRVEHDSMTEHAHAKLLRIRGWTPLGADGCL